MMRHTLVAAVMVGLLGAAACSTGGTDVRSQAPAAPTMPPLDTAEIERRSAQWEKHEPDSYSYVITNECECQDRGTFRVWVVGDDVVHTQALHDDAEPLRSYRGASIDRVFAGFREALMVHEEEGVEGAGATAEFSPEGLPAQFTVSWSEGEPFLVARISELVADPVLPPGADVAENVFIVVSNQSFDEPTMPVQVVIDDTTVVDAAFEVVGQHEYVGYELTLEPGPHTLVATSGSGAARTETVVIESGVPQHLYLGYWSDTDGTGGPTFDYRASAEPLGIA